MSKILQLTDAVPKWTFGGNKEKAEREEFSRSIFMLTYAASTNDEAFFRDEVRYFIKRWGRSEANLAIVGRAMSKCILTEVVEGL